MYTILLYAVIISAVILSALILMQKSEAGMGSLFGETDDISINRTRRGPERTIFNITIYASAIFTAVCLASFLLR